MSASHIPFGSRHGAETGGLFLLLWLFFFALAIRWIYVLVVYAAMGDAGLVSADGYGYLADARKFVELVQTGELQRSQWIGVNTGVMPLFSWLLALHVAAFGDHAALAYAMSQSVIDAATCVLVFRIAETFSPRIAMPSAIAAAINPTQIVLAGLVYTDTLFVFFVAVMLLGALRWMRSPALRWAIVAGIGVGGAALTRIMIAPWVPFLCLFLLAALAWQGRLRSRYIGHAAVIATVFCLCVAPIVLRNAVYYNTWALTSQSGYHFAYWVVPLVKEAKDGTPWEKTVAELQKRERAQRSGPTDNFRSSVMARQIGQEVLKDLGYAAIAKAWIVGAAINLGAPAIILSPPVSKMPRTGFFGTPGASPTEKIFNFLFRSDSGRYALILIAGVIGVAIVRSIQLVGFVALIGIGNAASVLLLVFWTLYVLAVNGPVASPKYRLPLEPAFAVMTGAGFVLLRDRYRRRALLKG
jgi:4-amino-4-deoxy-L-arabinose transferase-like glycosyltransferase